jgi:hypothetical protein
MSEVPLYLGGALRDSNPDGAVGSSASSAPPTLTSKPEKSLGRKGRSAGGLLVCLPVHGGGGF